MGIIQIILVYKIWDGYSFGELRKPWEAWGTFEGMYKEEDAQFPKMDALAVLILH